MRSAPRTLVQHNTLNPDNRNLHVTVEVIEPPNSPLPPLRSLPAPSSNYLPLSQLPSLPSSATTDTTRTYRIPRTPQVSSTTEAPKQRTHRLSKKKSAVLADKVFKREAAKKKKNCPRSKRFCKVCQVSCNGPKTFYDHINSRSHRLQVELKKKGTPRCQECCRDFETYSHLERHRNGAAHLKIVIDLHQNRT